MAASSNSLEEERDVQVIFENIQDSIEGCEVWEFAFPVNAEATQGLLPFWKCMYTTKFERYAHSKMSTCKVELQQEKVNPNNPLITERTSSIKYEGAIIESVTRFCNTPLSWISVEKKIMDSLDLYFQNKFTQGWEKWIPVMVGRVHVDFATPNGDLMLYMTVKAKVDVGWEMLGFLNFAANAMITTFIKSTIESETKGLIRCCEEYIQGKINQQKETKLEPFPPPFPEIINQVCDAIDDQCQPPRETV